jgi:cell division septation protein DedD
MNALQLAHRAVAKFPELTKRYQKFIGTAAVVSSAIIVLASIAVSRRLHSGESAEDILASITPDEIENAGKAQPIKPAKNGHSPDDADKRRFQH